jgi:magnesium transporter
VATALLFNRNEVDEVEDWASRVANLGRSSILWIDLECPGETEIRQLAEELELSAESAHRLGDGDHRPYFGDFESYLHVTAYAPRAESGHHELERVECLVSKHWLVTVRRNPVEVIETFRERAAGSGETGRLDGPDFLANLLDWVLEGYLDAFEDIELALEELDSRTMEGALEEPDSALRRLVALRQQIGRLRRALVSHREMFLALTRPELEAIASSESAERFAGLRSRLEEVVQAARDSRDSVVGSFDVLIARTEQRTNEIVKVLTLASVLLLPGALIAGVMGMNFKVGLFDSGTYFWVVIAGILGVAVATLVVARTRHWI